MPFSRLVKLALVDGVAVEDGHFYESQQGGTWRSHLRAFLDRQSRQLEPCLYLSQLLSSMSMSHVFLPSIPTHSAVVLSCTELCSHSISMLTTFPLSDAF